MTSYPPQSNSSPDSSRSTPPIQSQLPSPPPPGQVGYGFQPYPPPTRPGWVTAIGMISIVLAILVLVGHLLYLLAVLLLSQVSHSAHANYSGWYIIKSQYFAVFSRFVLSVLELLAGIMLLKRRALARAVLLTYAFATIGMEMVNTFIVLPICLANIHSEADRFGMGTAMIFTMPIAIAYPVFLLVWFFRPKIANEMKTW